MNMFGQVSNELFTFYLQHQLNNITPTIMKPCKHCHSLTLNDNSRGMLNSCTQIGNKNRKIIGITCGEKKTWEWAIEYFQLEWWERKCFVVVGFSAMLTTLEKFRRHLSVINMGSVRYVTCNVYYVNWCKIYILNTNRMHFHVVLNLFMCENA